MADVKWIGAAVAVVLLGMIYYLLMTPIGLLMRLFGYDPMSDYRAIVKQARGRRVVLADPGRSLVLTKPTGRNALIAKIHEVVSAE